MKERWEETWALLDLVPPAEQLEAIATRYSEPHRAYHNLDHVRACLDSARTLRSQLSRPAEVELALWYHDAIYDPRRADNEEQSARLAQDHLSMLPGSTVASITALILATRHLAPPVGDDARFVVDIDLAILGAPTAVFDAYERAIRVEYQWVPEPVFKEKRREILQTFLDRPRIYSTDHFQRLFESAARANIARSIALLS